jgi:hypothetical protein
MNFKEKRRKKKEKKKLKRKLRENKIEGLRNAQAVKEQARYEFFQNRKDQHWIDKGY